MEHTLQSQVFPACYLAPHGLEEIKSRDPFIKERVQQDGMDSVLKLKSLKGKDKQGVSIILNTDTDTTVDKKSHERLATAADQVSERTFSLMFNHPNKRKNGHSHDVLGEEAIQKKVFTFITAKDYPEILDDNPWYWRWITG